MNIIELEEEDYATLSGYSVSFKEENYKNFLIENISEKSLVDKIIKFMEDKGFNEIVIIKNLNVEEEFRGQGIGKALLEEALSFADIAILISDKYEIQDEGFILDNFYKNSDFEIITETGSGNLMVYPSDIAIELKESIKLKKKNQFKI